MSEGQPVNIEKLGAAITEIHPVVASAARSGDIQTWIDASTSRLSEYLIFAKTEEGLGTLMKMIGEKPLAKPEAKEQTKIDLT